MPVVGIKNLDCVASGDSDHATAEGIGCGDGGEQAEREDGDSRRHGRSVLAVNPPSDGLGAGK